MAQGIEQPRQLVVEGPADEMLFQALINHLGFSGIQIHYMEGVDNLKSFLLTLVQISGFKDMVTSLAIVRDADQDTAVALNTVQDALIGVKLAVPAESLMSVGTDPKVVILIVPPGKSSGALEDICLESVDGDPAMVCVDEFMKCVWEHVKDPPVNVSKARLQAFLSSRKESEMRIGVAAREGYWVWDHEAFEPLKQLLKMLYA